MLRSHPRYELLHLRLRAFTRALKGVDKGRERSIHRARVASRRLREVLPVLQLDADLVRRLSRRLRKVTHRLGTVRELDALLLLAAEFQKSGRYDDRACTQLASALAQERSAARDRLPSRLPIRELRRIGSKLDKIGQKLGREKTQGPSRAWWWAIEARLAHRAGALKTAVEAAGGVYLPDRIHKTRIAIKKLRYAMELASDVSPEKVWRRELVMLERTQDLLGRLRDRQMLIEWVRRVQASLTPPDLVVWRSFDGLVTATEKECRRLHGRYVRDSTAIVAVCARATSRTSGLARARRAG